jgi:hypothetical protein
MTSLLERVKFFGGDGGAGQEPAPLDVPDDLGGELLDQDPAPAPAIRDKPRNTRTVTSSPRSPKGPRNGGKFVSRTQVQKDVADQVNMWLKLWASMWSLRDEECAGALNQTSAVIAEDLAKLAARSDWIMEHFEGTSLLTDIGMAITHAYPFVKVVWAHHGPGAPRLEDEVTHDAIPVVDPNAYGPWRPSAG